MRLTRSPFQVQSTWLLRIPRAMPSSQKSSPRCWDGPPCSRCQSLRCAPLSGRRQRESCCLQASAWNRPNSRPAAIRSAFVNCERPWRVCWNEIRLRATSREQSRPIGCSQLVAHVLSESHPDALLPLFSRLDVRASDAVMPAQPVFVEHAPDITETERTCREKRRQHPPAPHTPASG